MSKDVARDQLNDLLQKRGDREVHKLSFQACQKLCGLEEFQRATSVMLFLSMPKEIDTSHAILQALQQDKTVLVPIVAWQERKLTPVVIRTLNCSMEISRYGLRNPTSTETIPLGEIDLVVAPGLGFDLNANRIGRGGGFYDRFLSSDDLKAIHCGFGFEDQVMDQLPVYEHDATMDILVTDQQVRRFSS